MSKSKKKSPSLPHLLEEHIDLPGGAWIDYTTDLPPEVRLTDEDFDQLWEDMPKTKGKVNVYGEKETPRYMSTFGKDYSFSKAEHESHPIEHPFLKAILAHVHKMSDQEYNGILVNLYEDGNHCIGKHSDSEKGLVKGSRIYSFSYGQERPLRVSSKPTSPFFHIDPLCIPMANNSLLIMGGTMQSYYFHEVPKTKKPLGRRINITVRLFAE